MAHAGRPAAQFLIEVSSALVMVLVSQRLMATCTLAIFAMHLTVRNCHSALAPTLHVRGHALYSLVTTSYVSHGWALQGREIEGLLPAGPVPSPAAQAPLSYFFHSTVRVCAPPPHALEHALQSEGAHLTKSLPSLHTHCDVAAHGAKHGLEVAGSASPAARHRSVLVSRVLAPHTVLRQTGAARSWAPAPHVFPEAKVHAPKAATTSILNWPTAVFLDAVMVAAPGILPLASAPAVAMTAMFLPA